MKRDPNTGTEDATGTDSMSTASTCQLDEPLKEFYDSHKVPITRLWKSANNNQGEFQPAGDLASNSFQYRFIRLNPRYSAQETLRLLKDEMNGVDPKEVPWLPGAEFYALPSEFALSTSPCFQAGRVYGMDVSSGAAVAALLSTKYDIPSNDTTTIPVCNKNDQPSDPNSYNSSVSPLRVLDLCCCPGLKLCVMADSLPSHSTVVGVDTSEHRMALCQKIVHKYHVNQETSGHAAIPSTATAVQGVKNIQLYLQDGTTFGTTHATTTTSPGKSSQGGPALHHYLNLVFDLRVAAQEESNRGSRKRKNKSARARESKKLKELAATELTLSMTKEASSTTATIEFQNAAVDKNATTDEKTTMMQPQMTTTTIIPLFDKVLVDAECSTDGSLRHMRERLKEAVAMPLSDKQDSTTTASATSTMIESNAMLTDKAKLKDLVDLQRRLLASGFRLLKAGGTLVYSTCSLSKDQNENVIEWLLQQQKDAFLIPVHFPLIKSDLVSSGSLPGTVRFYPNLGQNTTDLLGDGFFLAKVGKRSSF